MNLLLDTNIIIDWYTNGSATSFMKEKINENGITLSTSIICAMEFLSKAKDKEKKSFCGLINKKEIILYPVAGISTASTIAHIHKKTGLMLLDTIILHTASINNCLLITKNWELYQKGRQISPIKFIPSN